MYLEQMFRLKLLVFMSKNIRIVHIYLVCV